MRYSLRNFLIWFGAVVLSFSAIGCQNDDYLEDGGKHNPYYNGTVLDYLEQHPDKHYFSDLVEMIHYAGMDSVFQNGEIRCRIVAEPLGNAKISAIYTGYGVVEDFTVFPHARLCRFSSPTPQRTVPYQYTTNPCDWNCSVTRFFNAADGPF